MSLHHHKALSEGSSLIGLTTIDSILVGLGTVSVFAGLLTACNVGLLVVCWVKLLTAAVRGELLALVVGSLVGLVAATVLVAPPLPSISDRPNPSISPGSLSAGISCKRHSPFLAPLPIPKPVPLF